MGFSLISDHLYFIFSGQVFTPPQGWDNLLVSGSHIPVRTRMQSLSAMQGFQEHSFEVREASFRSGHFVVTLFNGEMENRKERCKRFFPIVLD